MSDLDFLFEELESADKVLVGAGAGLSAAAGLSYFDTAVFDKYYPDVSRLGYRCQYELVGIRDDEWSVGRKWAWWATHVNYVRYIFPAAELYSKLLGLLEGKDYFVVTSNADRQFMRSGIDENRLFEFQGNYDNMGCAERCTPHTWYNKPYLDRILEKLDHEKFECPDEALPRCPYCGGLAEMCFRGEDYKERREKYVDFVQSCEDKRLCIMELGVGFNTPGVIRWPFERITYQLPKSHLFRINSGYKELRNDRGDNDIPPEISDRATFIGMDAAEVTERLCEMKKRAQTTTYGG